MPDAAIALPHDHDDEAHLLRDGRSTDGDAVGMRKGSGRDAT
jgi:hypothetical protein